MNDANGQDTAGVVPDVAEPITFSEFAGAHAEKCKREMCRAVNDTLQDAEET